MFILSLCARRRLSVPVLVRNSNSETRRAKFRGFLLIRHTLRILRLRKQWSQQGRNLDIVAPVFQGVLRTRGIIRHADLSASKLFKRVIALLDWRTATFSKYQWRRI